jgi:hypothetical protein
VASDDLVSRLSTGMRSVSTLSMAAGSQLPGAAFFLDLSPPLFIPTALLTTGGGLAVVLTVFLKRGAPRVRVQRGVRFISAAVAAAFVYGLLLQALTVSVPQEMGGGDRRQIGFGMSSFSLTARAQDVQRANDLQTPQELMLAFGGYEEGGTRLIWKPWSIVAAALLLSTVFVTAYLSWTYGLALLAASLLEPRTSPATPAHA